MIKLMNLQKLGSDWKVEEGTQQQHDWGKDKK